MISAQKHQAKDYLQELQKYISRSPTRKEAYKLLASKTGKSEDAFRKAAKKHGLVKNEHSMHCALSEEEEKALVHTCILYARQYTPLTIPGFISLASFFAERPADRPFSRHFVKNFVRRHSDELHVKEGKVTSAKRCFETMRQNTIEFIESINDVRLRNTMNKNNIVVFDETIIGDGEYVPLVIGERRDSGGGNNNALEIRERGLGCYIPFSMPDGSTPFRVFIFKRDESDIGDIPVIALQPDEEIGLREHPHRLFLVSEKGYLTNDLFAYIMKEFAKWWTTTRPGLDCYLISDNLRIHKNDMIVASALKSGIHMLNIMPGSSHWFQVHDQLPFATLKNLIEAKKYELMNDISTTPEQRRKILMGLFYQAESIAFSGGLLIKSFDEVGLWPWNPRKILQTCEKHSPPKKEGDVTDRIVEAIKIRRESLQAKREQLLRSMKPVEVIAIQTLEKPKQERSSEKVRL